jgi:hypothetical protein
VPGFLPFTYLHVFLNQQAFGITSTAGILSQRISIGLRVREFGDDLYGERCWYYQKRERRQ